MIDCSRGPTCLSGMQLSLLSVIIIVFNTPVLFLLWHVKMSAAAKRPNLFCLIEILCSVALPATCVSQLEINRIKKLLAVYIIRLYILTSSGRNIELHSVVQVH